jgi:hypothetical protein
MIITVGTQPDPRDRARMRLSRADGEAVMSLGPSDIVEVRDLDTGEVRILRTADCGLDCRCAVEFADEDAPATPADLLVSIASLIPGGCVVVHPDRGPCVEVGDHGGPDRPHRYR